MIQTSLQIIGDALSGRSLALVGFGLTCGVIAGWLVFRRLLRQRELQVRHAERRAAESERLAAMGTLTAGLAHEIKNPLSTLVLNAQLLREEILDSSMGGDDRDRSVRRIDALVRETGRLKDILEDFLRLAGRVKPDPQPQDLREIAYDLLNFFEPQCQQAGVLLRQDLPADPVSASVDVKLVKQALLNLLLNGLQAMQTGASATSARELILRLDPATEEEACFHVIDTGPGIAPEQIPTLFRPYFTTKKNGTGLGLSVARRNIEEHGGRIEVFSQTGRGSDFTIRLPIVPVMPANPAP
ncbi:MAG: two-component sensor histidine kinase [Phycisphaerales bacterium]|nr:two-component sensor histidine kinase [Phycisphaerales bacterium]